MGNKENFITPLVPVFFKDGKECRGDATVHWETENEDGVLTVTVTKVTVYIERGEGVKKDIFEGANKVAHLNKSLLFPPHPQEVVLDGGKAIVEF